MGTPGQGLAGIPAAGGRAVAMDVVGEASLPQRRLGKPAELDGALLLLASDSIGQVITGITLVVDGGHSIAPA